MIVISIKQEMSASSVQYRIQIPIKKRAYLTDRYAYPFAGARPAYRMAIRIANDMLKFMSEEDRNRRLNEESPEDS